MPRRKLHWTQTPEGKRIMRLRSTKVLRTTADDRGTPELGPIEPTPATLQDFTTAVEAIARVTRKPWQECVSIVHELLEK